MKSIDEALVILNEKLFNIIKDVDEDTRERICCSYLTTMANGSRHSGDIEWANACIEAFKILGNIRQSRELNRKLNKPQPATDYNVTAEGEEG